MKIDILTLFPNMFDGFLSESIIKRATLNNKVEINVHDIREYSKDPHKKVDDYGFGGGAGMVLMPQPINGSKTTTFRSTFLSSTITILNSSLPLRAPR